MRTDRGERDDIRVWARREEAHDVLLLLVTPSDLLVGSSDRVLHTLHPPPPSDPLPDLPFTLERGGVEKNSGTWSVDDLLVCLARGA